MLATISPVATVVVEVIAGLLVVGILAIGGYFLGKGRSYFEHAKVTDRRFEELTALIGTIAGVLSTPSPTVLNPFPPKGLIIQVREQGALLETIAEQVTQLVADSKPDAGHTSRDAVDRVAIEQGRVAIEHAAERRAAAS